MMACLSDEVEAGRVVVMVAMIMLLSCVTLFDPSMVVRCPAVVMVGWLVRYCCVVTLSLLAGADLFAAFAAGQLQPRACYVRSS
jgi:uncharacterized membrane protein YjjB (DUF3815 family)